MDGIAWFFLLAAANNALLAYSKWRIPDYELVVVHSVGVLICALVVVGRVYA